MNRMNINNEFHERIILNFMNIKMNSLNLKRTDKWIYEEIYKGNNEFHNENKEFFDKLIKNWSKS